MSDLKFFQEKNIWSQFSKLATLKISLLSSSDNRATIFGNGNNQVGVAIYAVVNGSDGKPLPLTLTELRDALYLCNYRTGVEITSPWTVSFTPNEFHNPVSTSFDNANNSTPLSQEEKNESDTVVFYISCADKSPDELISIGINIPGVGKFDSSENGTSTLNGPGGSSGSSFKSPSYVQISTLLPINYSVRESVAVTSDRPFTLKNNLWWESKFGNAGPYKEHWNAKVSEQVFRIAPNPEITPNNKFLYHTMTSGGLKANNVHDGKKINWQGSDVYAFTGQSKTDTDYCAVFGKGYGWNEYNVYMWYPDCDIVQQDGNFIVEDTHYYYRCSLTVENKHTHNDGIARLYLYNFILPESNCYQDNWHDASTDIILSVADVFGNTGKLTISFSYPDFYNKPYIH
jgi:hypothetical protein